MKKSAVLALTALFLSFSLTGCRWGKTQNTTPDTTANDTHNTQDTAPAATESTAESQIGVSTTESAQILENIWAAYDEDQRFATYGGTMENPVDGAPGDLDISNKDELMTKYMIPEESLSAVTEGASLVHLMNSNVFTAGTFRLQKDSDLMSIAKVIRGNIQRTQWICGSPDRLLMAQPKSGFLLIAFGSEDAMQIFRSKLTSVYPDTQILYNEAIVS